MKVYINGRIVDHDNAVISVFDRGFLYGDAVFETVRVYDGKIFRLKEHLDRLYSTMKALKIKQPFSDKEAEKAVYDVLDANEPKKGDLRLRITVSRGRSVMDEMDISKSGASNVVITVRGYTGPSLKRYENGIAVKVSRIMLNSRGAASNFKTVNYLNSILGRNEAFSDGFFDAIFLNESGRVCEASTSNVFMVKGNGLMTPSISCGILPGITRKIVLELSPYVGLGVKEGEFSVESLKASDEVFLTNSMFEIMPVTRIDNRTIGNSLVGKITKMIHKLYKETLKKELNVEEC